MLIFLLWLKKLRQILKPLSLTVNDRVRMTKYNNIFSDAYNKTGQEKYLLLILCSKLILGWRTFL